MKLRDYEILYDLPTGEYSGAGIGGIRTTTIRAGRGLEVMCHPIFTRWPAGVKREVKRKATKETMKELNRRNRIRKIARLIDANFTEAGFFCTLTYDYPVEDYGLINVDDVIDFYQQRGLPEEMQDVRRDVRRLLAKIRRRLKKGAALKWLYRIEETHKGVPFGFPPKFHAHMVIEAEGLTREMIERLWEHGLTTTNHLELKRKGGPSIAGYINKGKNDREDAEWDSAPNGGRWWSHSRNLKEPKATVSDRKVSRRRACLIAADMVRNGREIMEKLYPGYRLMDIEVKYSDFMNGVFIYVRMRRLD